jgi:peptide/nickel transport system permease protein
VGRRRARRAIFVVSLAFNLLGDGLRDALDPKAAK